MTKPLEGLRILDLTQGLAGPYGAMMLAEFGADVIKVEPPQGDLTRHSPPHYIEGTSLYYISNNQRKRSIVVDLKLAEGYGVFADLVRKSDAVYYNFGPGVAGRLKIDAASLARINPEIVVSRVEGYGARNDIPDQRLVDVVAQGAAGAMSITGEPGRPPVRAGVPSADLAAGMFSLVGLLVALLGRRNGRQVTEAETTLFHSQLSLLNYMASYAIRSGVAPGPVGSAHVSTVPSQAFRARDAWMVIDAGLDGHFRELVREMGCEQMADDPRYATRKARNENRAELLAILEERFLTRDAEDWLAPLRACNIPCSRVNNVIEAVAHPGVARYGMLNTVRHGQSVVQALGAPIWFDGVLGSGQSAAPRLGEHSEAILRDLLGYSPARIRELQQAGAVACAAAEAAPAI